MSHMRSLSILSRFEVEKRVKNGEFLIIFDEKVYDLTNFIDFHPGGRLAIEHMAGRFHVSHSFSCLDESSC